MTSALDSEPAQSGNGVKETTGAILLILTTKRIKKRIMKRKRIRLSLMMRKRTTLPSLPNPSLSPSQTCAWSMRLSTRMVHIDASPIANAEVIECAAWNTIGASVSQTAMIKKKMKTRTISRKKRNRMTMKLPSQQTIRALSTRFTMS